MPPKRKPRKALSELHFNTLEGCAALPPGRGRWKAAHDAGIEAPSATWANEKAKKERHTNGAKSRKVKSPKVNPPPKCRKGIASTASSVSTTSVGTAAAVSSAVSSSAPPASFALVGLGGDDLSMLLAGEGDLNGELALKDSDLDELINSLKDLED